MPNGVTQVAGGVVDALRTSPVILLVVLLNVAFAGGTAYFLTHLENNRWEMHKLMLDRCVPLKAAP